MKKIISCILILAIVFTLAQPVFAAQPPSIEPQYTNANKACVTLNISDSGKVKIVLLVSGKTGLKKLIWISDHTLSGPQGYYWLGLAKACVGDVIIWDTAGTRSVNDGTYDHAMVVTRATGTSGSRGVSNLCVAANTSATTSAYMPLAQYCSYSASCFATAHITGGYYKI